jgi:hypothetical protein
MHFACPHRPLHRVAFALAAFFGLATILAGATVLFGWRDAGYEVVQPVLLFNTVMGFVYLGAALLIARDLERGRLAALVITLVNFVVLAAIVARRVAGDVVADETLVAMTARCVIWAAIAIVLTREKRAFAAAGR